MSVMILIWLTFCLALGHVSSRFLKNIPQFLHNAGNDAYWESWSTLKVMEHAQKVKTHTTNPSLRVTPREKINAINQPVGFLPCRI